MAEPIKTWSTCANLKDPSVWDKLAEFFSLDPAQPSSFFGVLIQAFSFGGIPIAIGSHLTIEAISALIPKLATMTMGYGCIGGALFLGTAIGAILMAINWFNNFRLACVEHDACAVGTIVHDPHSNANGDLDLDILIAPYSPAEHDTMLEGVFDPPAGGAVQTHNHIASLDEEFQSAAYGRLVEEKILPDSSDRAFQHKYLKPNFDGWDDRFLTEIIRSAPHYRCPGDKGSQPEMQEVTSDNAATAKQTGYLYLPCVIEGHVIVEWLKNILYGLIAALAAFIAACLVCMYFTLGNEKLCAVAGGLAALLVGLLTSLFAHLLNEPAKTKADGNSIGAIPTAPEDIPEQANTAAERGDIVVAYGDWVLYLADGRYYQIHPVKAWYLIARSGKVYGKHEAEFDVSKITSSDYQKICEMVKAAETIPPKASVKRSAGQGLALLGAV